jgi:hypothetical protein
VLKIRTGACKKSWSRQRVGELDKEERRS